LCIGVVGVLLTILFYIWPRSPGDSLDRKIDQMGTNLPAAVSQAVEQKLSLLDSNRVRVETLTEEVRQLRIEGEDYKERLDQKEKQLAGALQTNAELRSKLAGVALSSVDQERVKQAAAAGEKGISVMRVGTLRVVGSIRGPAHAVQADTATNEGRVK
jgi:hypothetical protein